ncbi:MAG: sodium:solute symporter [Balneolaceae bacterium]|nr:sodium:solute symporter [Balneolaceae bacterium]
MQFGLIDYIVLAAYLIAVAIFGLKASGKQTSTRDFFLGGDGIPWWAVLFSVVATETSTLTFISIPAVAYGGNLTFLQITVGYFIGRVVVALYFLPKYFDGEMYTAYQFLEKRFGRTMRVASSSTFMITRLLADGVRLFATAIPLAIILRFGGAFLSWTDLELYLLSISVISVITLGYTFFGGIKAVVWMDVVQLGVYVGGALLAMVILLNKLPDGWSTVTTFASPENKFQVIRLGFDLPFKEFIAQPYTLITAIIGGAVFSLASHGTDQLLVQRLLASGDLKSGQKALIWSGVVVMAQFALFLIIGLMLYAFYEAQLPSEMGLSTNDEIFAKFIVEQLPVGISGLIVAALFAAAMSSLSSSLNSLASATTFDVIKSFRTEVSTQAQDLKTSRIVTLIWGVILTGSAFLFAVLQLQAGERPTVVELGLGIASYTYGGLLGAFGLGMLFQKPDKTDAIVGFFTGLICLLFLVDGPVQNILPGDGLVLAWPLYTLIGSVIVIGVGWCSATIRQTYVNN